MYGYDENGRRIAKAQVSGGTATLTFYPFEHYEQRGSSSSGVTKYYFFGGERFAMRTGTGVGNGLRLLYKDRISSTVHATDQNGSTLGSTGYTAFGATMRITGTMPTDHRFTDQQLDGTGLYYYGARYYDPSIGQFISPDTVVPDPTNVMDYQRYAYARGNPLKYNDPSGYIPEKEACRFLNACSQDAFIDKYGQKLADLLWDTDVNWGDKLEWGDNVGMLVLLEDGRGGHSSVLWGIEGAGKGRPIWLDSLKNLRSQGFDTTSRVPSVSTVHDLPMADEWKYGGYYATSYYDLGEAWWAGIAVTGISGLGRAVGTEAGKQLIPPVVAKAGGGLAILGGVSYVADQANDLVSSLGDAITGVPVIGPVAKEFSYYGPRVFSPAVSYPVIRFSPVGSLPFTLHLKGPGGD